MPVITVLTKLNNGVGMNVLPSNGFVRFHQADALYTLDPNFRDSLTVQIPQLQAAICLAECSQRSLSATLDMRPASFSDCF